MMRFAALVFAVLAALIAISRSASAHEFRPAIIDVTDLGGGRAEVVIVAPGDADISLALPAECTREAGNAERFTIRCSGSDLAGRVLGARGLSAAHPDALVRFEGSTGKATFVLRADSPSFTIPGASVPRASTFARMKNYFAAGVGHIAAGADHLLFVLGLLLLVRGAAGIARAVTAFTIAHSITLALATTAAVHLPPAPVEALIAVSLVLVAVEIARAKTASATLARRHPSLIAFAFGLLHGFGFAGGLADLRVPAADLPLALFGFNLGVEAGQLAFVAAALALAPLVRRVSHARRIAFAPAYLIGSLGVFFTLDRLARLWTS